MKTTVLGVLTIGVAVANAAISFLKTGTFDFASAATAVTAGFGLIKAHDAAPPTGGATQCAPLACLAALCLAVLALTSCGVVETKPDGTRIEKKADAGLIQQLGNYALEVLRIVKPAAPAAPAVRDPGKDPILHTDAVAGPKPIKRLVRAMKPRRELLTDLAGLPLTLPLLAWWGFCLLMAKLTGELDRPNLTPRKGA